MNPKLNKLIIDLSRGIAQRRLYFADHPLIVEFSVQIVADLKELLGELKRSFLFIGVADGHLIFDGEHLVGPSIMGQQLVEFTQRMHCGGLVLTENTTSQEILSLLDIAQKPKNVSENLQESRDLFREYGVHNIEFSSHYSSPSSLIADEDKDVWQGKDSGGHLHSPLLVYQALFDVVAKAHGDVTLGRDIDINSAESVSEHLLHSARANFTDMLQFVHYPDYDSYTVGHSVRVATLVVFVGDQLGLNDKQLLELGTSALLHDIGKSKIPSEILFKKGGLTDAEFTIMQSHARLGAEILLDQKDSSSLQVAAAWGHHLRFDGGGYPAFPDWAVCSHLVALLHICDVFEALTAVRPYKAQISPLAAYGVMLADRGAFDPGLLHVFISTLGIYPPGNHVRLNDGSEAIVIAAGSGVDKPLVKIIQDKDRNPIEAHGQHVVDLSKETGGNLAVTELLFVETV